MSKKESLNKQQQAVVNHSDGPLLVVAGAGTGKTRVIIERINKLLDDGVDSSAILAVTFTEKAASEMLDRVLSSRNQLLPELSILTFNGFGDMVQREYGMHMGLARNFRLLGPQAQIVFFRERIDEFTLDYFLPLTASPDSIIEDILRLFSQLKQHIITPDDYRSYAAKLPTQDEAEKLDKRKHQELAEAYETYVRLCRSENVIDYDDQIYLCIQLLRHRPNVQKILQNKFHTVFVDEFQDTNPMQSLLIDLIVNKEQNLVVVGDDDQSIYGFRGATLQNILNFKDRYPSASEVALTENYRSHQAILDASYKLIQNNNPNRLESSLSINKHLTSSQIGNAPHIMRFESLDQEIDWLAKDIKSRIDKGDEPGSIAILARRNHTAQRVHDALTLVDVANRVIGSKQDLYTRPVVRMLAELARTITEPDNNISLHHSLTSEIFGISNKLLAPLAAKARYEHSSLEELLNSTDHDDSITQSLSLISSWREQATATNVRVMMWNIINESGYFEKLKSTAFNNDEAGNSMLHLSQFFDSLREFESIAMQPTTAQYLESLPALMAAGESTDDGTQEINGDEVTVTTIHKAKGLEWPTVYVPDLTEQSFPLKRRGGGLQLPDELRASSTSPADEHYAEERRLMYVAVTRARENLILSFSDKTASGSSRKPSRFIDEMFAENTADSTELIITTSGQQSLLDIPVSAVPRVKVPSDISNGNKIYLSVSSAAVLMECPLNFYYKFILKAPEEPTPRTTYGSYLHGFFESINKAVQLGKVKPLADYIVEMEAGWERAGYVSKATQEKAYKQAHDTLTKFYNDATSSNAPIAVEEPFEVLLEPENIILRGKIDVVLDNDGIEIRDYKTGNKVKEAEAAKKRAAASSQLTMYALAWQLKHGDIPERLSLEFVDTGQIGSVKKTQRGIDGLRKRLAAASVSLKTGEFTPGSRHDYCIHPPIK